MTDTSVKEQHHLIRMEMRSEALLRDALPALPPVVAVPLARLVAHLTQIRQVQDHAPGTLGVLYVCAYPAYREAHRLAAQRLRWLTEYGVALLPQLAATSSEARFLTARLARVGHMADASLTALITAQCALDEDIAHAEDLLAA
ncbi:MAG: hypothetical protein H0X24_08845 [Ktedonobacterales bacterium]|nr:hypothetical protein [Ktedonobacterales bacterium]